MSELDTPEFTSASECGDPAGATGARRNELMQALRTYSIDHAEFGRRLGSWLSLHATDAMALMEISDAEYRGDPLTPSGLARRILLTSGGTTSLINRLEEAGHVARSRVHDDRRVVTLRTTAQLDRLADEFFSPLVARLDALIEGYELQTLDAVKEFLDSLHATMNSALEIVQPVAP